MTGIPHPNVSRKSPGQSPPSVLYKYYFNQSAINSASTYSDSLHFTVGETEVPRLSYFASKDTWLMGVIAQGSVGFSTMSSWVLAVAKRGQHDGRVGQ